MLACGIVSIQHVNKTVSREKFRQILDIVDTLNFNFKQCNKLLEYFCGVNVTWLANMVTFSKGLFCILFKVKFI